MKSSDPNKAREHFSTDERVKAAVKAKLRRGDRYGAVILAHSSGYRIEEDDLDLQEIKAFFGVTDPALRTELRSILGNSRIVSAERACARIEAVRTSGWCARTKADDDARDRAQRETEERDRRALIEAKAQELRAAQAASAEAEIRNRAAAMVGR